jgi:hypothetical protein
LGEDSKSLTPRATRVARRPTQWLLLVGERNRSEVFQIPLNCQGSPPGKYKKLVIQAILDWEVLSASALCDSICGNHF